MGSRLYEFCSEQDTKHTQAKYKNKAIYIKNNNNETQAKLF
jgi:hypothetical protein